jgi:hypothetical protein
MSNEPTVVELTFEGDDRVFLSSPTLTQWPGKIRQPLPTLSRTTVLAFRCGLTPG